MPSKFSDYTVSQPDLAAMSTRYDEFHERLASANSAEQCLTLIADWDRAICEFK